MCTAFNPGYFISIFGILRFIEIICGIFVFTLAYTTMPAHVVVVVIAAICVILNLVFMLLNFLGSPALRLEYFYTGVAVLMYFIAAVIMSVYWSINHYNSRLIAATIFAWGNFFVYIADLLNLRYRAGM